jgi:hypothetical protein
MRLRKQAPQSFLRPHLRRLIIFSIFFKDDKYNNYPANQRFASCLDLSKKPLYLDCKGEKMLKSLFSRVIIMSAALFLLAQGSFIFASPARDPSPSRSAAASVPIKGRITLSTTTSTQDSGLLNFLLPIFTRETGWEVDTIAVGTGAALQMGRDGDADVLLVHSRADEIKFVEDGYAVRRYDVMYNDYLVVGPNLNAISHNSDVLQTFRTIASRNLPFVSRGDNSGTHTMERNLWRAAGINYETLPNYTSVG